MRSFHPRVSLRMRRWIVETQRSTGIERCTLGDAIFLSSHMFLISS